MRALVYNAPGEVAYASVPDPELEAPGDVLVRVEWCAICGSDLHPYRGHEKGLDPGTVMGHEFVGEVIEAGSGVAALRPGDRVVSPFTTSCGDCFFCRRGLTSRCERGQLFGWRQEGEGLHGAQAEVVRVPLADGTLVVVPEAVASEAALLAGDVYATGYFCAEMGEAAAADVAVVIGCGAVGLMAVAAARRLGAGRVFAVDTVAERLGLAEELGAEPLDAGRLSPVEEVLRATGGRGADSVLEAVGSPQASRLAYDLVRAGGVIAAAGVHTEPHLAFGPGEAYDKNLTYRAGRCPVRHYLDRLLAEAALQEPSLERVISHRLPLARGPEAYGWFDRKLHGCVKALLRPGEPG